MRKGGLLPIRVYIRRVDLIGQLLAFLQNPHFLGIALLYSSSVIIEFTVQQHGYSSVLLAPPGTSYCVQYKRN